MLRVRTCPRAKALLTNCGASINPADAALKIQQEVGDLCPAFLSDEIIVT
jgi:hypothetical protein